MNVQSIMNIPSAQMLKSNLNLAKSRITSALDKFNEYQIEKRKLQKQLPQIIRSLQFILSILNSILFFIYVAILGFTISACLTALNEDCLKVAPSYDVLPERVRPNTISGYKCTGIHLIEHEEYTQMLILLLLIVSIGLQVVSSLLAFIGAYTLTTKNIKMYIWLFVISTVLLISFVIIDFPMQAGRQYIKYFGAFDRTFLFFMLVVAITQIFSGFFSIVLLVQWTSFINEIAAKYS